MWIGTGGLSSRPLITNLSTARGRKQGAVLQALGRLLRTYLRPHPELASSAALLNRNIMQVTSLILNLLVAYFKK